LRLYRQQQQLAEQMPQAVELVDKTEDDRDAVVIDAEILQVSDQPGSGEIDV
jgi:hypothetical protein